jgi:ATP-dependent protease HslVU (ClpYQ) peptidase subunit
LLIGHQKKLYEVLMDFQVNEILGNFTAVGSGASYAMGAMYVLDEMNMGAVQKLEYALQAACKFHISCAPPFDFEYI